MTQVSMSVASVREFSHVNRITHVNHCLSFIDIQVESWTIDLRLAEANASQPASGLDSGFSDTQ